ncbi:hypothetical protein J6590_008099 [Homalodisca vitripennis]|nr:hypothetical protein J6590_008099 [Homalodisca vitripennis]
MQVSQRASVQHFPPARHTFYRADLPEGYQLCEDSSSDAVWRIDKLSPNGKDAVRRIDTKLRL